MSNFGYNAVFTSFFHTDENGVEDRYDAPTLDLDSNNGYWTGPGRPLLPATGWHEMPDAKYWDDQNEEAARFRILTSYRRVVTTFWYEYRWFGHIASPTSELVWTGDSYQWERNDMIHWCPFPDWERG